MILTVIGSGTAIPSRTRASPCCHLDMDGKQIVFDLGSGALHQLRRRGIDVREVDLFALSHFHPDHTADLVPLLFALRNPEFAGAASLSLLGPRGLKAYLKDLGSVYGEWVSPPFEIDIREAFDERLKIAGLNIETAPTGHTPESIAFRAEDGRGAVAVYGGDSPYSRALVTLGRGADLLVLECSFPEGRPHQGHLTPSEAGKVAAEAGAKRLLLTHFYPETEGEDLVSPARSHFSGEILLADDGMAVKI